MRKVKPKNYATGRWVLTIKTGKQGNFLKAKARWVLRGFLDKLKEYQQTDSPASTRPGFRMSCQTTASTSRNIFHIDLKKRAFLQGQSYDVNRDVVCRLPPEAGYPPHICARLKKTAYGINDALLSPLPSSSPTPTPPHPTPPTHPRWWNTLDKALCSYGMVPTRTGRCGYVLYSIQSRERTWKQHNPTQWHDTSNIPPKKNRVCGQKCMLHFRKCWIPLQEVQLQENPWQESLVFFRGSFWNRWNRKGTTRPSQTEKG